MHTYILLRWFENNKIKCGRVTTRKEESAEISLPPKNNWIGKINNPQIAKNIAVNCWVAIDLALL